MFADYFKQAQDDFSFEVIKSPSKEKTELELLEAEADVTKKIRKAGIKIRSIIPTKFGLEVVLYNKEDAKEAGKVAGTKKVDGNSIFID